MHRVAISILNYNSMESTIACVHSLLSAEQVAKGGYLLEVQVADNASGADEQHHLQRTFADLPNVNLQKNTENVGFSAGHNRNLQAIFSRSTPDYIWLLNNDCLVGVETLPALLKCAQQNPDVGIWGATLLEADGQSIQCAGGCFYNAWFSSYRQYGQGNILSDLGELEPVIYDYIAGASLFFPVSTLQNGLQAVVKRSADVRSDENQWLNESFFLYFEELDLAKRLKPGLGMAWCKDALIRHVGGASTGANGGQRSAQAEYQSTLSALKFTCLYYPSRLWFMAPARYFSKCLLLGLKGDFRMLKPLTRAYRSFWLWLSGVVPAQN